MTDKSVAAGVIQEIKEARMKLNLHKKYYHNTPTMEANWDEVLQTIATAIKIFGKLEAELDSWKERAENERKKSGEFALDVVNRMARLEANWDKNRFIVEQSDVENVGRLRQIAAEIVTAALSEKKEERTKR